MTPSEVQRDGVALLVVLATLVVLVTAAATLAQLASTTRLTRERSRQHSLALDLLRASDAPARRWLRRSSSRVALPPDSVTPRVDVLADELVLNGWTCHIRITAWDQRGMVPSTRGSDTSLLASWLPYSVRSTLDDLLVARVPISGLDQALGAGPVFPRHDDESAVFGALVATHHGPEDTRNPPAAINVNTAPRPLLERALRTAGRGGIEAVMAARADGRAFPVPLLPEAPNPTGQSAQLLGSSDAWALRIDVRVGTLSRSWWCVYQRQRAAWACVQRIPIDE